MAQTLNIYNNFLNTVTQKQVNLKTDDLRVMLVTSAYRPDKTNHAYKSNVTNEISGAGYTAGGQKLQNVTYTVSGQVGTLQATNPKWTGLTLKNLRYAVLYDNTPYDSGATDANTVKPLIAYIDFGDALTIINAELEIVWNVEGIIKFTIR